MESIRKSIDKNDITRYHDNITSSSICDDDPVIAYFGFCAEDQQRGDSIITPNKETLGTQSQTMNNDSTKTLNETNKTDEVKQKVCKRRYQSFSHKLAVSQSEKAEYTKLSDTRQKLKSTDSVDTIGNEYTITDNLAKVLKMFSNSGSSLNVPDIPFLDGPNSQDCIDNYIKRESKMYREYRLYQDIETILMEIIGIIERIGGDRDWRHSVVHINEADRVNLIASCALELDSLNRERKQTKRSFKKQIKNSFKKHRQQISPATSTSVFTSQLWKNKNIARDEPEDIWQTKQNVEEEAQVLVGVDEGLIVEVPDDGISWRSNRIADSTTDWGNVLIETKEGIKKPSCKQRNESPTGDGLIMDYEQVKSSPKPQSGRVKDSNIIGVYNKTNTENIQEPVKTQCASLVIYQQRSFDSDCSSHFELISKEEIEECLDSEPVFKGDMDLSSLIDFAAVLTPDSEETFFVCD